MLHTIWLVMLIVGCVLFVLAVILTFALKIPEVADELSGRKAKRQIQKLKELNQGTGALENLGTDEVYSAMSSGSLLSQELSKLENSSEEEGTSQPVIKRDEKLEEENPTTAMDEDDIPTGYMKENEQPADNEEEIGTTIMDDLVTSEIVITEIKSPSKKGIRIIEEQSSIL